MFDGGNKNSESQKNFDFLFFWRSAFIFDVNVTKSQSNVNNILVKTFVVFENVITVFGWLTHFL